MPAEVRFCSCCVQQKTFSNSRYKTCDDCRERTRNIGRMKSTTRLENEADDGRRRGRKKQLPAAYISQLHRMKPLEEVSRVKKQLSNAKKDVINNYFWDNHAIALQQDIVDRQRSQTKLETSIISIESSLMSQHSKQLEQSSISTKRLQESSPASTSSKKRLINLSSSTSHLKVPSLSEEESSSDSLPSTSNPLTETENSPKHATDTSPSTPSGRLSSAPKLNDTPPSLFSPTKSGLLHSPVPILETNAMSSPPFSEVVETDGIVCDTTKLSIATIIKREATNLHDQYKHGNPLSSRQRKIMSNGLSSILDLVDQSYTSQRKLFTSAEWQQINQLFQNKHRIPDTSPLNPTLSTTLKVIDATLKQTSNIKMGLLYLYKIYGKHHSTSLMPSLQIFEHVLNLLDQESDLLQVKPTTMISETDYVAYIWLPLFRKLFHAGTNIQIKTGETTFPFSTACKQQLYPGASNVTGFKIDLRFVVHQGGLEFDVCSVEACCNSANDDKIIADEGKLNREVKDDLDGMISRSLPRFDIMLPRSTAELIKFEKTMVDLLTFHREVLKSVNFVMEHFISNKQLKSLNRPKAQMTSATQDSSPQRDTWYTPPKGTASRQPVRLVSAVPQSLNAKLLSIACEESMAILQKKSNWRESRGRRVWMGI
ncbi:hypothetical protein EDC96DRAFT_541290 [Choanephora cucurbitarum]|nr:hypothetical protein EDC96DRAFT_541290 [Choanephora cucurbitarum]